MSAAIACLGIAAIGIQTAIVAVTVVIARCGRVRLRDIPRYHQIRDQQRTIDQLREDLAHADAVMRWNAMLVAELRAERAGHPKDSMVQFMERAA